MLLSLLCSHRSCREQATFCAGPANRGPLCLEMDTTWHQGIALLGLLTSHGIWVGQFGLYFVLLQAPKHPMVTSEEMLKSFVTEPKLW